MRKIDLILENIRDEYMINLLEEGETTELEVLKTKKFLNESLGKIRKMLVEEVTEPKVELTESQQIVSNLIKSLSA
jgi:hypothetical protein